MILGKLKAGALQFAILISVVVALLLASFLLLTYTQQYLSKRINLTTQTMTLSHNGIAYAGQQALAYDLAVNPDIEGIPSDALELRKTHWGIYDKVISTAELKNTSYQKIALLGGQLSTKERPAIHLNETNTPLVLVGNTRIKGNVRLPQQGVRAGNIAGNYFQGNTLINGNIGQSSASLPSLLPEKRAYLNSLIFNKTPIPDSLRIFSETPILEHTFKKNSRWLYRPGVIQLDGTYTNNIIIKSDTLIRISNFLPDGQIGAKAANIMLIAPHIEIQQGFRGSLQALASKSITIGDRVQLDYPSALVLWEKGETTTTSTVHTEITLGKGSRISGSVVYLGNPTSADFRPKISIAEGAQIIGEVYCEKSVQLKGSVIGSVFTHIFATAERGSIYQNHIYNGIVDSRPLPESYCGLLTINTSSNLVAWVD